MSLFQEAYQAESLLPTLGPPCLCPVLMTGWRPCLDGEPPKSKENLYVRSIAGHREDRGWRWLLGEGGRKEATLLRAERTVETGAAQVGRVGKATEATLEPWGAGTRVAGLALSPFPVFPPP